VKFFAKLKTEVHSTDPAEQDIVSRNRSIIDRLTEKNKVFFRTRTLLSRSLVEITLDSPDMSVEKNGKPVIDERRAHWKVLNLPSVILYPDQIEKIIPIL
jgi:hypothetical protein